MTLLSMREYAKHRGVTFQAVSQAVKRGRITCKRDDRGYAQIDPAVADREWDANSDPMKFRTSNAEPKPEPKPEPVQDSSRGPDIQTSTKILKAYQARLAKLEFEERSGKLQDSDQVKKDAFKVGRSVRDAIMGIPARVSAELAAETDRFVVHRRLEDELRQALAVIASELEVPVE